MYVLHTVKAKQIYTSLRETRSEIHMTDCVNEYRAAKVNEITSKYERGNEERVYHAPINDSYTVRNLNKSHRIATINERKGNLENTFMLVAMKSRRAEEQRDARRAKR